MRDAPKYYQAVTYRGRPAKVSDVFPEYLPRVQIRFDDGQEPGNAIIDYRELDECVNKAKSLAVASQHGRLSDLQKAVLYWIDTEETRTKGSVSPSHVELVKAVMAGLQVAHNNVSHSLKNMEGKGLMMIGRTPAGKAQWVRLTPAGKEALAWAKRKAPGWPRPRWMMVA